MPNYIKTSQWYLNIHALGSGAFKVLTSAAFSAFLFAGLCPRTWFYLVALVLF